MEDTYLKCAKRKCSHKHYESERIEKCDEKKSKDWEIAVKVLVCPKCGHDEYYVIKK